MNIRDTPYSREEFLASMGLQPRYHSNQHMCLFPEDRIEPTDIRNLGKNNGDCISYSKKHVARRYEGDIQKFIDELWSKTNYSLEGPAAFEDIVRSSPASIAKKTKQKIEETYEPNSPEAMLIKSLDYIGLDNISQSIVGTLGYIGHRNVGGLLDERYRKFSVKDHCSFLACMSKCLGLTPPERYVMILHDIVPAFKHAFDGGLDLLGANPHEIARRLVNRQYRICGMSLSHIGPYHKIANNLRSEASRRELSKEMLNISNNAGVLQQIEDMTHLVENSLVMNLFIPFEEWERIFQENVTIKRKNGSKTAVFSGDAGAYRLNDSGDVEEITLSMEDLKGLSDGHRHIHTITGNENVAANIIEQAVIRDAFFKTAICANGGGYQYLINLCRNDSKKSPKYSRALFQIINGLYGQEGDRRVEFEIRRFLEKNAGHNDYGFDPIRYKRWPIYGSTQESFLENVANLINGSANIENVVNCLFSETYQLTNNAKRYLGELKKSEIKFHHLSGIQQSIHDAISKILEVEPIHVSDIMVEYRVSGNFFGIVVCVPKEIFDDAWFYIAAEGDSLENSLFDGQMQERMSQEVEDTVEKSVAETVRRYMEESMGFRIKK